MIVANGPLYFGCLTSGHYLFDSKFHHIWSSSSGIAWMERLDGVLPPQKGEEIEGEACIHIIHGWTVIAFWDRSVDTRNKSNSIFFIPGIRTGEWALAEARKTFPSIFERFAFEVRLKPGALAEALRTAAKGA